MTTEFSARLFAGDEDIRAIGTGLIARTLPREAWTHEAHLGACLWLLSERPDIDVDAEIADIIRGFNESVGGVNDDHNGYHETITQAYLAAIRAFVAALPPGTDDAEAVARLLATPMGDKAWPLTYWSRERLFSVEARRAWVEPDLEPLPHPPT